MQYARDQLPPCLTTATIWIFTSLLWSLVETATTPIHRAVSGELSSTKQKLSLAHVDTDSVLLLLSSWYEVWQEQHHD